MSDCTLEGAHKRAEEIRLGTERLAIEHAGETLGKVTVSIGLACFSRDGETLAELLAAAAKALSVAKQNGRNQVVEVRSETAATEGTAAA